MSTPTAPTWLVVAGLLVALLTSAGLASLLTVAATKRKTISEARKAEEDADRADAEARKVISEATLQLMQPLINRAAELEARLRATEDELVQANRTAAELTRSLQEAQVETQGLRNQVDQMSKDLTALQVENERLRGVT